MKHRSDLGRGFYCYLVCLWACAAWACGSGTPNQAATPTPTASPTPVAQLRLLAPHADGRLSIVSVDLQSGVPGARAETPIVTGATAAVALGSLLFVSYPGGVHSYRVGPGTANALTPVAGSPFLAATSACALSLHPNGQLLYVSSCTTDQISTLSIDQQSGRLTSLSSLSAPSGCAPGRVAVDSAGRFAYVECLASRGVQLFAVDSNGGLRDPPSQAVPPESSLGWRVAVDPFGPGVYASGQNSHPQLSLVRSFRIGPDGALSQVSEVEIDSYYRGEYRPSVMARLRGFPVLYVCQVSTYPWGPAGGSPAGISWYTVDPTSTALTRGGLELADPTSMFEGGSTAKMALAESRGYVFMATTRSSQFGEVVSSFRIENDGSPKRVTSVTDPTMPRAVALALIDP